MVRDFNFIPLLIAECNWISLCSTFSSVFFLQYWTVLALKLETRSLVRGVLLDAIRCPISTDYGTCHDTK